MPTRSERAAAVNSQERLELALDLAGLALWDMEVETGDIRWDDRGTEILGYAAGDLDHFEDWLERVHPGDVETIKGLRRAIADDPELTQTEIRFRFQRPGGDWVVIGKRCRVVRGNDGQAVSVAGVFADETRTGADSAASQAQLEDLQHRINNMFSIIRSVARRTREKSPDLDAFSTAFEGRLGAFARTHAALARTPGDTVELEQILREELRGHAMTADEPWSIEGPVVPLKRRIAETMALAVHELVINAVEHGALSTPYGTISIRWEVRDGWLRLDWREAAGHVVPPPERSGFGRETLERALPYQIGARTRLAFEPEGLRWNFEIPLSASEP